MSLQHSAILNFSYALDLSRLIYNSVGGSSWKIG